MARVLVYPLTLLVLALLLGGADAARAAESYDNCTGFITSIPTVINSQGTWCLKQDLATAITSGSAITISTNNVTLDCNDFKLGGLAAGSGTQTSGILSIDRFNATIRHCNIRGFYYGVLLTSTSSSTSGGHLVEDNRLDGNTFIGLRVEGDGSLARRNRVIDTGGTTTVGNANAYGIQTWYTVDVLDNTVSGVVATGSSNGNAFGIDAISNVDGNISGNRVRGLLKVGSATVFGIFASGSDHVVIRNNDLAGDGSVGSGPVACSGSDSSARDNTFSRFSGVLAGCSDDGGNVTHP
jgi:hypothetical protein